MKKLLKTGKKTLSVIMAVMMVLTAWVWVAPTEASAATAGTYDVKVRIQTTDSVDVGDEKNLELTLNFKKDNGTGAADKKTNSVSYTWAQNDNADNTWTITGLAGYPTSFSVYCLYAWTSLGIKRKWSCTITISVKDNDTGTYTQVAQQSFSTEGNGSGQTDMTYTISSIGGTPSASRVTFLSGAESVDIPKTGASAVTQDYTAGVYDQYGVRMTHEPTYYVRSTAPTSAQTSSSSITGVSMSSGTSSGTLTVNSGAQNTSADTKNVYVHAKYGSVYANKTVALNDPTYTYTYNKNTTDSSATIAPSANTTGKYYNTFGSATISGSRTGFTFKGFYPNQYADSYETANYSGTPLSSTTRYTNDTAWYAAWQANQYSMTFKYRDTDGSWVTSNPVTEYYGRNIPFPSIATTINEGVNYTHTFTGWAPAHTTVQAVNNQAYVADYSTVTHYATLTALENAIAAAKAKQETDLYKENAYTETTVAAFEDTLALAESTVNRKPLLSEQDYVNALAESLNNANENLDIKNYTVIFTDEDGTILKDGYFFVPHGSTVTIPQVPAKNPDEANHYAFDCWDYEESDRIEECNYVTDNLIYVAAFAATPHSFTETTTPSTCTADGVITKTCDCGYSYTAANPNDLAGHTWSTDYKELAPATCATAGSEAKYCTACDAIDESTKRDIAKLGHNFGSYSVYAPATCFGKGAEIATCSRCEAKDVKEIPQKSHAYGAAETVEKTCTTDGYTKEVCTLCGFTNIRDIDITKGHTLKVESVPETCVSVGYAKTYCENCDFEKTTTYPATGWHSYPDTWETVAEASCVGHGVEKRVCTVCNSATETRLTALAEHTAPADWTVEVPASCDSEGRKVKDCTVCGKELEAATIAKLGHSYEAYADGTYDATCTTAGATAEKCSRCGDVNTTLIQPTGHSYKNEGAVTETDATCTSGAYKTYNCDNCDYSYVEIINGSTALTHDFTGTEAIIKAATCEADGEKTVQCKNCAETTKVIIPKLGHSYGAWQVVTEATNSEDGQWKRVCANNPDHVEYVTIPKGGHAWDNGTQTLAPTCTTTGKMVCKCTAHANCGVTLEVTVPVAQHTVAQRETPATCTTQGSVEAYCEGCGKVFNTMPTLVVPHTFDNGTATAATCTTSGYTTYTCTASDCGFSYKVYDETKPATGHNFDETITENVTTNPATCTDDGSKTVKCAACDKKNTVVLPKTGHTYVKGAVTQANCTTAGTEVYTCACGDTYTKFVEAAKGHTFGNWTKVQDATDDKFGIEKRVCTVEGCGVEEFRTTEPIGKHTFTETITKKATCTETGLKTFTCSAHTNCTANYTEEIPATGHNAKLAYIAPTCTNKGSTQIICDTCSAEISELQEIPATGHTYSVTVSDATCTTDGTRTYSCACGDSYTETIPAKGHSLTTTVTDATCGVAGSVVTECSRCDYNDTIVLAAKNHNWNNGEIKDDDAATCEDTGTKTYTCTLCGATKTEEIPATGHTWGAWNVTPSTNSNPGSVSRECAICHKVESVEIPAGGHNLVVDTGASTEATCTTEGTTVYKCENHADCGITVTVTTAKTQHNVVQREIQATCTAEGTVEAYCSVCNNVLSTEAIPVKAHSYVAKTTVDPTCTTSGYTVYACDCGDTYKVYDETKPATPHDLVEGASTATCTEGGEMTLTCSVVGCTYSTTVEVPAKGHAYDNGTVVQAQSCVDVEKTEYKCNACQTTYIEITKEAKGHTFGDWEVVTAATADKNGVQKRTCSCGAVEYDLLAPIGDHVFTEAVTKNATCTEKGLKTFTCSVHENCTANYTQEIPATGHTQKLEYTAPSCNAVGYSKVLCEKCPEVILSEEIPALGHIYGDAEVTNATCKDTGKLVYNCNNCDDVKTVVIPTNSNAHQYETTVVDATCYEKGSVVTMCALCGKEAFKKELPMVEHKWNNGEIKQGDAATCEADGKKTYTCTVENCGATKTETVAKLGHDWNAWVKVDATNDTDGSWTRTCKNDVNHVETVVIPKGDHKLVVKSKADATCTKEGKIIYGCETHTDCSVTVTVTTAMLQHILETNEVEKVTCESNGKVVTSCTSCNAELVTTIIPATGHSYSSVVTKEASCTEEGVRTFTCAHDANHTYTEAIAKLQHNYIAGTPVPATCTSSGYTPYSCTCGSNYVIITAAAKGHSFTEKVSSTADCLNGGKLTLKCACGVTMETDVPALGHDYRLKSGTTATCAAAATETYECSRCDDSYTISTGEKTSDHKWGAETVVDATNTSLGYKTRTCEACGQVYFEIIPATGEHNFNIETSDKLEPTCTADGYIVYSCSAHTGADACNLTSKVTVPATGHKEKLHYTPATCEIAGETKIVCETCTATIGEATTIPVLGHDWIQGEVIAATCNEKGSVAYSCSRCSETKSVEIDAVATAHKLKVETVLATCDADGTVTVTCENGCTYNETTTLPKLEHDWGEWTVETAATNTTPGVMKRACSKGCEDICEIPAGGHSFDTTNPDSTTDATCKEQGTATYNCTAHTNCGVTITVNTGFAEHTYKTDVVESCSEAGSVRTYCAVCDKTFASIALGMAQHEFKVLDTTDPTCTSSGYTTYKCENCNATYNEIGDAPIGHTITKSESKATCTTGDTIVISCENCDFRQEVEVPALGHDYKLNGTAPATCAAAATETYKCSRCEANYTISVGNKTEAHDWNDWEVVEEATYTSLGYKIKTCKVCGKLEVETIPATGDHVFDNLVSEKAPDCVNDGEKIYSCSIHPGENGCKLTSVVTVPATGHDEVVTTTDANCEDEGTVITTCSKCDYKKTEAIPALGHAYGEGVVTPATCKDEGKIEYECGRCSDVKTVVISANENAHQYETVVVDATCTSEGSVYAKCKLCGDETEKKALPVVEHSWGAPATTNATCTDDGKKVYTCSCGATKTETIAKLGHNMKAGTAVAPTCTTSGYTPYTCENNCGHSYNVYDATVKEHNYVQVEGSSTATCTDAGEITLKCDACGNEIKAAVPALGHDWGEWSTTKNPTAEVEGIKERSCQRVGCDATETVTLPKLGHEMVKDKAASKAPSCTDEGEDVYVCITHTDCGYTYTVKVAATGHSYDDGVVTENATCTEDGVKTYTCSCGDEITEAVPATGHTLSTTVNEATCTAPGSVVTRCACGYSEEPIVLDTLPHKETLSIIPADCENAGYAVTNCEVCNEEIQRKEISALGHNFDDTIEANVEVTETATCAKTGSKEVKCSRCDEVKTVEIPKLSHEFETIKTVPATCTESGYIVKDCKNCDEAYNEFVSDPTGHDWNSGVETTPATCTANGEITYTCTVAGCGATKTEVIAKLGHDWGDWEVTLNPTATVPGIQSRKCKICGATETATIPALGGTTTYTVTFVVDGNTVATQTVNHNGKATAPEIGNKAPDASNHYSYIWDVDFSRVTSDLTVTAIFTPAAHSYGEWITDIIPTCETEGRRYRLCTADGCGYAQYETVDKAEHAFSIVESKDPTCTENGYKSVKCEKCGFSENQTLKRLGHVLTYHEAVEPTCDTDGLTGHYSCSRCGKNYKERTGKTEISNVVISKKYHTFLVVEGSEATCTKDGQTDYMFCTVCGYTRNPETIPATGHADANNDNTCDKCGSTYMENGSIVCSCSCHKNGFFNELIYKILSFFWRLFGINKSCECGRVHY